MTISLLRGSDTFTWALSFPYDPAIVALIKPFPGIVWNSKARVWQGAADAMKLATSALFDAGYAISGVKALADCWMDPYTPHAPLPDNLDWYSPAPLRPYQKQGFGFLRIVKRGILGDAMGLGKTLTALACAVDLTAAWARMSMSDARIVIVCPNYVRSVWVGEIAKWFPEISPHVWQPSGVRKKSVEPPYWAVAVISYDILHAWSEELKGHLIYILDEAHALMSPESQRSVAARTVSASAPYVWALTGTPLTNRIRDLYNIVDTIRPGAFGNFFSFGLRYCGAIKEAVTPTKTVWKFDGKSNLEELHARLAHYCLRRTVSDVGIQLPPKTRQVIWFDVPARAHIAVGESSRAALRKALDSSADAKLDACIDTILDHVRAGHKVVAFSHRRAVADALVDACRLEGMHANAIHGGIPVLRRGKAIEEMKGESGGCLLACTIDSSATGIDLSFADVGCFIELTWEPHELLQAEARLHRFGQAKPVLIQYLLAKGTAEELIASVVVARLDTFTTVVGDTGESLGASMSSEGDADSILGELYAAIAASPLAASPPAKKKRKKTT